MEVIEGRVAGDGDALGRPSGPDEVVAHGFRQHADPAGIALAGGESVAGQGEQIEHCQARNAGLSGGIDRGRFAAR
jgi:hypothetical protein